MSRVFRWLGGADESILERCPTERMRFAATGGTVLMVGMLATVSATLTGHLFLHMPIVPAVILGIGWGCAIVTLDRWLILTIRRQATPIGTLALAVPRVALAVVAGLVIAKPVVLITFRNEIAAQATSDRRQEYLNAKQKIDQRYAPELTALTTQENTLVGEIGTIDLAGALKADPVYQADLARAATLQREAAAAATSAAAELDGTGGSRHVGAGPIYAAKQAQARQLAAQASAAQQAASETATADQTKQSSASAQSHHYERTQLAQALARQQTLRSERAREEGTILAAYRKPIGLADRLAALSELVHSNSSIGDWDLVLTLLVLLVDACPALGKAMVSIGPPTLYERQQDEEEKASHAAAQARAAAYGKAETIAANEIVDQATLHRSLWQAELNELVPKVIAIQRAVTEQAIEEWANQERQALKERVHAAHAARGTPGEPPHSARAHAASDRATAAERRNRMPWRRNRKRWWRAGIDLDAAGSLPVEKRRQASASVR
jgi:hypothetical protein